MNKKNENEITSLKELNLSKFNTNNVRNMKMMFQYCSSLREIYLSNFNIKNVSYILMFGGCSSLKEINFPNFD